MKAVLLDITLVEAKVALIKAEAVETLLPNSITIHSPPYSPAIIRLVEVISIYPKLWEDSGFVDIP